MLLPRAVPHGVGVADHAMRVQAGALGPCFNNCIPGCEYDLIKNNCNVFSSTLLASMTGCYDLPPGTTILTGVLNFIPGAATAAKAIMVGSS
mmetsp:Transcript_163000/g.396022  ORF Transcript_163000/g.396022 Transcript_163000/m.396022 type:complete len:92 (+) Transcript_163000:2-277(+)